MKKGEGKIILKEILAKYLSTEGFNGPKIGFGLLIGDCLRGLLREWTEDLLEKEKILEKRVISVLRQLLGTDSSI